jgi:ABC-type transport system involved in multi-copper enzyme maturation permease subunit
MSALVRIWVVAHNTLREAVRSKLLYTLLFFAIALILAGVLISTLSYVERERIVQDVGMGAIRLFSVGIAIFVGVGLIHNEVERRTIFTILSKPISRTEFLLGKYVGLVLTTWIQVGLMAVVFALTSLAVGAPFDVGHLAAFGLTLVELMVMVAVATLFSSFTTPLLASLFSLGIYAVGHMTRELRMLGEQSHVDTVATASALVHRVLPDLEAFNLTIQAVHGLAIPAHDIWLPVAYGVGYTGALLFVASTIFGRRDFR